MGITDAIVDRLGRRTEPTPEPVEGEDPTLELAGEIAANPETVTLRDGRDLGYADVGDPEGDPLFLFHGFPNSRVFGALFDEVGRERGVRVLAPERPGFGVSDPDPDRRLTDWPADLAALADELGVEEFPVLGISAGGPYAVVSAALLSERVTRAGVAAGLAPMESVGVRDRLWYYSARFVGPLNKLGLWLIYRQAGDREAFLEGIAEDAPAADRDLWTGTVGKVIHESMLEARRHHGLDPLVRETALFGSPWGFDLGAIDVPVSLWYGEADSLAPPAMGSYFAEQIPTAEAHFFSGFGHLSAFARNERDILQQLTD